MSVKPQCPSRHGVRAWKMTAPCLSPFVSSLNIWGYHNGSSTFDIFSLFLYCLDWLLSHFLSLLRKPCPCKTNTRNKKGYDYCLDIFYSCLLLLLPTGPPFQCLLATIGLYTLLFSSLPGIFFCLGLSPSPKGPFQHRSELISIPLVPENALPVLLFNVPFSASRIFTLHFLFTQVRGNSSQTVSSVFQQLRTEDYPHESFDAWYFPWQICHFLNR